MGFKEQEAVTTRSITSAAVRAQQQGAPTDLIAFAVARTRAAVVRDDYVGWSDARVCAYFDGVARRRALQTRIRGDYSTRIVARSVVFDLIESGRSPRAAFEELVRGWSDTLSPRLIEEFRSELCA